MRESIRRFVRVSLAVVACVLASSCSSGASDPGPTPGCTRPTGSAAGPGDTQNYFPSEVGWSWTYRVLSTGLLSTTSVSGTQTVGSEVASVFTTGSTLEYIVERPSGAYVLSSSGAAPPFDQLYPSLILPFPVVVTPATQTVNCTSLDVGDLDGDGRSDVADVVATIAVLEVADTITVEAGTFANLAHAEQYALLTVRSTSHGSVSITMTQDDWYGPGVGRVRSAVTVSGGGTSDTDSMGLVSYTPPVPVIGKPAGPGELSSAPADAAPAPLERALRLARAQLAARG